MRPTIRPEVALANALISSVRRALLAGGYLSDCSKIAEKPKMNCVEINHLGLDAFFLCTDGLSTISFGTQLSRGLTRAWLCSFSASTEYRRALCAVLRAVFRTGYGALHGEAVPITDEAFAYGIEAPIEVQGKLRAEALVFLRRIKELMEEHSC